MTKDKQVEKLKKKSAARVEKLKAQRAKYKQLLDAKLPEYKKKAASLKASDALLRPLRHAVQKLNCEVESLRSSYSEIGWRIKSEKGYLAADIAALAEHLDQQ